MNQKDNEVEKIQALPHDDFEDDYRQQEPDPVASDLPEDHPMRAAFEAPDEQEDTNVDILYKVGCSDSTIKHLLSDPVSMRSVLGAAYDDAMRGWAIEQFHDEDIANEFVELVRIQSAVGNKKRHDSLGFMGLEEFYSIKYPELKWALEGYIPLDGALCVLAAYNKVGKSTLLTAVMKAIVTGTKFCGIPTTKSRVAYINFEERPADVQRRLMAFGLDPSGQDRMFNVTFKKQRWSDRMADEIAAFADRNDVKVFVFDTLSKIWTVKDENNNAEVGDWTSEFQAFWHRLNVSALAIHHSGKGGGSNGTSIRGASAIGDNCDIYYEYGRPKGLSGLSADVKKNLRVLTVSGRYETPDDRIFSFDTKTKEYSLFEGKAKIDVVLDLLKSEEPLSLSEIIDQTKASQATIYRKIEQLEGEGYIKIPEGKDAAGKPRYRMAPTFAGQ